LVTESDTVEVVGVSGREWTTTDHLDFAGTGVERICRGVQRADYGQDIFRMKVTVGSGRPHRQADAGQTGRPPWRDTVGRCGWV
jgi:hypothetical protein